MLNPLLLPPALIKRALDDLHSIGDAARRLTSIERAMLERLEAIAAQVELLRAELEPIRQLTTIRAGVEPLDDDLRQVREAIDRIEPLLAQIGPLLGAVDEKLGGLSGDLAPVGELAEKLPGVGRR